MKVGVIGLGTVGSAVLEGLRKYHEVSGYDKKSGKKKDFEKVLQSEVILLCLPTPSALHGQDLTVIENSLKEIFNGGFTGILAIKSTILPGTIHKWTKIWKFGKFVACPEFLSADTAKDDFVKAKTICVGGDLPDCKKVIEAHKGLRITKFVIGSSIQMEMLKYVHNVFLAVKVGACNELYEVCTYLGLEYQGLMNVAADITGWINPRHIKVPGKDNMLGFGGDCFPKDIHAFSEKFKHLDLEIITGTITSNRKRRKQAKKTVNNPIQIVDLNEGKTDASVSRTRRKSRGRKTQS